MTPIIETGKRVAMLATIGGIGAVAAVMIAASHGVTLPEGFQRGQNFWETVVANFKSIKGVWEIVTAGVFWATAFNWAFENWFWRWAFLRDWLVKVPDLTGIWEGTSESHFFKEKDGTRQKIEMTATIEHNFERIKLTKKGESDSVALAVDLSTDENGFWTLTTVYHNLPKPSAQDANPPQNVAENIREHYGCERMTLLRPPKEKEATSHWRLSGHYWTSKSRFDDREDRGTTGTVGLEWKRRL